MRIPKNGGTWGGVPYIYIHIHIDTFFGGSPNIFFFARACQANPRACVLFKGGVEATHFGFHDGFVWKWVFPPFSLGLLLRLGVIPNGECVRSLGPSIANSGVSSCWLLHDFFVQTDANKDISFDINEVPDQDAFVSQRVCLLLLPAHQKPLRATDFPETKKNMSWKCQLGCQIFNPPQPFHPGVRLLTLSPHSMSFHGLFVSKENQ